MSFILDALKRAERERRLKKPPDLRAVYEENHLPRRGIQPWFWLSGSFLIGAIVVAFILWPEGPGPEGPPAPTAASVTRSASVTASIGKAGTPPSPPLPDSGSMKPPEEQPPRLSPPQPVPSPAQAASASAKAEETGAKTEGKSVPQTGSKPAADLPDKAPQPSDGTIPATPAGPGLTTQGTAPVEPAAAAPSPPEVTRIEPAPAQPPPPSPPPPDPGEEIARSKQAPIPLITELPAEVREKLGKLQINVHSYSEVPAERLVFINMRRYKVGDRIGEKGPILKEITPEGVIIDYGEGQTRLEVWR